MLVVGTEKLSQWVDWTDRTTAVIFADGAGAAVVGPSDTPGIGPVVWGSAGDKSDRDHDQGPRLLPAAGRSDRVPLGHDRAAPDRQGDLRACRRSTPPISPLSYPHQANLRIIEAIARKIGADNAVVAKDIVLAGNTSAASIPLALSRMIERGEVRSGGLALLLGFGAGLTYAGQVIEIP